MEALFTTWQRRWTDRREQIVRRLETLDRQLDRLAREGELPPRFALVGVPADAESMTSMVSE